MHDLWFVEERLRAKGISAEDAAERTRELTRFLALSAEHGELPMISSAVDEAWHAFLLFTREYEEFCRTQFGRFLHHCPTTSRTVDTGLTREEFVRLYEETFGAGIPALWTEGGADCGGGEGPGGPCNASV